MHVLIGASLFAESDKNMSEEKVVSSIRLECHSMGKENFFTLSQEEVENPEIHFEPIVKLTPVKVEKLEENEEEIFSM